MTDHTEELDGVLRSWVHDRDFSGGVLVTRSGAIVLEGCYGLADRANALPVTPRTRFGLASVTKLFTACAVVDLVAGGRLGFHDRLVDVLTPAARPSTLLPDVTVHHLLTHTSGIADYAEEDPDTPGYLEDYGDLWRDRPVHRMERPADFLPLFGDLPPHGPPGRRWHYSNAGYVLLGLVIEAVSGSHYAEAVTERVFSRAGMHDSGFFRLDEPRTHMAVGYLPVRDPAAPRRTNIYSVPVVGGADGGAFSNARDLDRFLHALEDGTLLGVLQGDLFARYAEVGDGYWSGYGVVHYPDGRYGHGGGDPGVEVLVNRWPREDRSLIVLSNVEGLAGEARDLLLDL